MWRLRTYLLLLSLFAAASGLLYYIHYLIFEDVHHIFIFMVGSSSCFCLLGITTSSRRVQGKFSIQEA